MDDHIELVESNNTNLSCKSNSLFEQCLQNIREDLQDNTYIMEAFRVLSVEGYRSSIGCIWNAVVDDLRNKIIHRSLDMFNKEMKLKKEIKNYEDFQDYVLDDELIEGAYKIGVIGWEANKILKQAKNTRHIFDGHPKSTDPTAIKVISMLEDCIKYVLSQDYPVPIIDIDEYVNILGTEEFDRNDYTVDNTLSSLPERYKNELINRLFTAYINDACSSVLRSNMEFVIPILWSSMLRDNKIQVIRRVDQEIIKGHENVNKYCFDFVHLVEGMKYLSVSARKHKIKPLIDKLLISLDNWDSENKIVNELFVYSAYIPNDMLKKYIWGITQTYVGKVGGSANFARTDFYADGAAILIPLMFDKFDDNSVDVFLEVVRDNKTLQTRIKGNVTKMNRLRSLADRLMEKISQNYRNKEIIEMLLDEKRETEFFKSINQI